jgi:hypothetical protein
MLHRRRRTIRLAAAAVVAVLLIIIAINTTTTAGDASSAERAIESYAKAAIWMLAIIGLAISAYIATSADE